MSKYHPKNYSHCEPQSQLKFCVPLSFNQELVAEGTGGALIPLSLTAQNTDGIYGVLKISFNKSLDQAAFKLYVFNATDPDNKITMAHIHFGTSNVNGPIIVGLYQGSPKNVDGLLSSGTLTNKDIVQGASYVNSLASLYQGIVDGFIYSNVHSVKFPGGVARGHIFARLGADQ